MLKQLESSMMLNRRCLLFSSACAGLSFLMPPLEGRAADRRGPERRKSLLTIWLDGGPSQLETWDPHPTRASGSSVKAIKTSATGLQIADLYPQTAEAMQHLSVIRSLVSKEGDHERGTYHLKTGYRPDPSVRHPSIGSILVHETPAHQMALPPHVALDGGQWPPRGGFLGDEFDAFRVSEPGGPLANTTARVSDDRQRRRMQGLDLLQRSFTQGRAGIERRTLHRETTGEAIALMQSEQLSAFEIADEPLVVKRAYGETRIGRSCLVARRLLESGVRAIEVTLGGFDSHTNNLETHRDRAAELDPALSTLVAELASRDLLASTVILVIGEFGRTPKINAFGGRDHWPSGFSCLIGGGGLASGKVIGATDPAGTRPPSAPVPVADLFATVLSALDLEPSRELMSPIGRPLKLSEGSPLLKLVS